MYNGPCKRGVRSKIKSFNIFLTYTEKHTCWQNMASEKEGNPKGGPKPKVLNQDQMAELLSLASVGVPMEDISEIISPLGIPISERTIFQRIFDTPEVSALYKNARSRYKASLWKRLYEKTHTKKTREDPAVDTATLIFMAKTVLRLREKDDNEISGELSVIVRRTPLDDKL